MNHPHDRNAMRQAADRARRQSSHPTARATLARGPRRRPPRPAAAARPRARTRGRASARSLSAISNAGLASILLALVGGCVLSPFAIYFGNKARRLARQARVPVPSTATVGLVLGWIEAVLFYGCLLLYAVLVVAVGH